MACYFMDAYIGVSGPLIQYLFKKFSPEEAAEAGGGGACCQYNPLPGARSMEEAAEAGDGGAR